MLLFSGAAIVGKTVFFEQHHIDMYGDMQEITSVDQP